MQKLRVSFYLTIGAMTFISFGGMVWAQAQQHPTVQAAVPESATIPPDRIPQPIRDAVNATDRPATDKNLDAGRQPEQMLAFFGIQPGMKVADLWAGTGYTTELLSRTVGTSGMVYSQNPPFPPELQQMGQAWTERLKNPVLKNVVAVSKSSDAKDMLPAPPGSLDVVLMNMNYHDLVLRATIRLRETDEIPARVIERRHRHRAEVFRLTHECDAQTSESRVFLLNVIRDERRRWNLRFVQRLLIDACWRKAHRLEHQLHTKHTVRRRQSQPAIRTHRDVGARFEAKNRCVEPKRPVLIIDHH